MSGEETEGWAAIPRWVVRDSELSAHALLVYLALSTRANRSNQCWPSIATIAREARCAKSTARKALDELRSAGLVAWEKRPLGKVHDTNIYSLLVGGVVRAADQGGPSGGRRWSAARTRRRAIEVEGGDAEVEPENATEARLRRERDAWLARHGLTLEEFEAHRHEPGWLDQFAEAS